jgi:hypothetical protein
LTFVAETEGQVFEVSDASCLTAGFDFLAIFLATFAGAADGPCGQREPVAGQATAAAPVALSA